MPESPFLGHLNSGQTVSDGSSRRRTESVLERDHCENPMIAN